MRMMMPLHSGEMKVQLLGPGFINKSQNSRQPNNKSWQALSFLLGFVHSIVVHPILAILAILASCLS